MITKLSDNPGPVFAGFGALLSATIALLQGLHIVAITGDQVALILAFYAALSAFSGLLLKQLSVPRTPTGTGSGTLQTPPPGTTLVMSAAASASQPVSAADVVAGPTPPAP